MNLTSPSQVKSWCIGNGFHPNRTLGQNFLIDRNALDAMVAASGVAAGQRVLEIGSGLGVLTEALLAAGTSVTAIEKDSRLVAYLQGWAERLAGHPEAGRLRIIEADALELPLDELFAVPFDACVSNLPYSVGTRILLDIARHPNAPARITVMVQKEVAERFVAGGGEKARGQAGVWLQRDYDVTLVRQVRASCFWPRPEVGSAIVRLTRRPCPLAAEERQCFEELTRTAFMHRRKQMGAVLRDIPALAAAGIDPKSRAETLTNQQWLALAQSVWREQRNSPLGPALARRTS